MRKKDERKFLSLISYEMFLKKNLGEICGKYNTEINKKKKTIEFF